MSKWKSAPLGDLAEVKLGKMLDQKKNQGDYKPYLGNDNVQWNEFNLEEVKEMRFQEDELERFRLKPGDLMVCEGGDPGRCALWEGDDEVYYQKALHRVRVGEELDARYLLYYMLHIGATKEIRQYYTGGATIKHLPNAALKGVFVRYPDVDCQRRIAEMLKAYDDLIDNSRRQIKLLEEAAQRLYREWFVDMRFPGHEEVEFVDGLPDGWKIISAAELCDITIGKTPSRKETQWFSEHGVKWASVADLGKCAAYILNTSECLTNEAIEQHNVKIVRAGTILLSFKMTIGRIAIAAEDMVTNEAIAHFRVDDSLRSYIFEYLRNFQYDCLGSTSSISTAINSKIVKTIPIVLPKEEVLSAFVEIADGYLSRILVLQKMVFLLQEARDRLLPKLMSGEIEV